MGWNLNPGASDVAVAGVGGGGGGGGGGGSSLGGDCVGGGGGGSVPMEEGVVSKRERSRILEDWCMNLGSIKRKKKVGGRV